MQMGRDVGTHNFRAKVTSIYELCNDIIRKLFEHIIVYHWN